MKQHPNLTAKPALFGTLVQLQINILNRTNCKALFGKESCQRSWLRDWKTFCLYTMFGCRFDCKSDYCIKVNPSGFSYEKPPPFTQGRRLSAVKQQKQGRPCFKFYYMYITGKRFRPQPFWQPSQKACPKHRKTRCKPFPAAFSKRWFGFGLRFYFSAGTLSFYS